MDALSPISTAYAASCLPVTYSACAAGVRTATFDNCDVGIVTVDGSINLTFSDAAVCNIATVGDSVNRTGSLTLSALGGSLAITTPGGGQTLTRTATGFTFAVPGMERVLTLPSGRTLFDISTMTTSPLVINGTSRADMVIAGGTLVVHPQPGELLGVADAGQPDLDADLQLRLVGLAHRHGVEQRHGQRQVGHRHAHRLRHRRRDHRRRHRERHPRPLRERSDLVSGSGRNERRSTQATRRFLTRCPSSRRISASNVSVDPFRFRNDQGFQ